MVVQHVAPENWSPSQALGTRNGKNAAKHARQIGFPDGVNVWLDLEGAKTSTPHETMIAYCNAWFAEVEGAGFVPGVYVGARAILTGNELFWRLTTKHYWKSGSRVPDIPHRGYQLIQIDHPQRQNRRCCNRSQSHQERQLRRLRAVAVRELIGSRVNSYRTAAASLQWFKNCPLANGRFSAKRTFAKKSCAS